MEGAIVREREKWRVMADVDPTLGGIQRIGGKAMWGKGLRGFVRVRKVTEAEDVKEAKEIEEVEEKGVVALLEGETDGFGDENMGNGSMRLARE